MKEEKDEPTSSAVEIGQCRQASTSCWIASIEIWISFISHIIPVRFQVAEQKLEAVVQVRSVGLKLWSRIAVNPHSTCKGRSLLPSNMTLLQMFTGKCLRRAQFERRTFDCRTRKLCWQLPVVAHAYHMGNLMTGTGTVKASHIGDFRM